MFTNSQNQTLTKKAIMETIVFFDMFDYPLTEFELWKYSPVKCEFEDVKNILNIINQSSDSAILKKNNFYFLKGREKIVETRLRRYNISDRKIKRALLVSKIFKMIPWIKMIAIGNIIGSDNMREDGDIDFFIVTEKNRIWLARLFCVLVAKILGMRPKINDVKDKVCLSFFVSEDKLDLQDLMIEKKESSSLRGGVDIYFIHWLAGLLPIYDGYDIYKKLIEVNSWINNYFPNWQLYEGANRRQLHGAPSVFYKDVIDMLLGGINKEVGRWQIKSMPQKLKDLMNKDKAVIVNDQVLKLHVLDRREYYREKFEQAIIHNVERETHNA